MADSIFERDGELFLPTGHARGPWSTESLHGGAPAALFAGAFERMEPGAELRIARIGVEYLRPLTFAPLELSTGIARPGRRVQELTGELRSAGEVICRASALRVQSVPEGLPSPAEESPRGDGDGDGDGGEGAPPIPPIPPWPPAKLPGPSAARPAKFALNRTDEESFAATAMEMRWFGDPWSLGPGRVWMRMRLPLLAGEALTPLMRAAAVADFANGASAALPFDRYLFINADLTIHLARQPRGEWIALDARTVLEPGGSGLSDSVLHDEHGPFARAFQTLVVQLR